MLRKIILLLAFIFFIAAAAISGIEKESRRQCILAINRCEKYPDSCGDVKFYCEN